MVALTAKSLNNNYYIGKESVNTFLSFRQRQTDQRSFISLLEMILLLPWHEQLRLISSYCFMRRASVVSLRFFFFRVFSALYVFAYYVRSERLLRCYLIHKVFQIAIECRKVLWIGRLLHVWQSFLQNVQNEICALIIQNWQWVSRYNEVIYWNVFDMFNLKKLWRVPWFMY